ncbi:4-coumarate--CoA ligase-like 9 isoform X2 [Macadamia integrifolia]|uniref:4-coumarate--CoA ligase-like 9 isoform X2 n=1 Tax=Macadamia integrifolia TaxID=60698 RepID=UPI001C4F92DC|nr:4-coumarate--CoA ligase-like 9 isoform X2 [Macadamia integrifolia]
MDTSIDPRSGFCSKTKTYKSLRPPVPLLPETLPLSAAAHSLLLLRSNPSPLETTTILIDVDTGNRLSAAQFLRHVESLAASLQSNLNLSKEDAAFILLPPSIEVPILYFSLLSLGVVISPANPINTKSEISHQIQLCNPSVAFATTMTAGKLPSSDSLRRGIVLLDSPAFQSMMTTSSTGRLDLTRVRVSQSDPAAILYSSGTTGRVKGAILTHRNLIALIAGYYDRKPKPEEENPPPPEVSLMNLPLFHVFGFFMCLRAVALGETVVLMKRFDFEVMLKAIETYKVTYMPVSPPLVVAMAKSDLVAKYDLSSLRLLGCGGAPLGKEVAERFVARFPNVEIVQGYGLTETTGTAARSMGPDEAKQYGSVGHLAENVEAKIVDPKTGEAMPPGHQGELWLRGPIIMRGTLFNLVMLKMTRQLLIPWNQMVG